MPKITKRVVDAAAPDAGRYIVWDSEIKGFGLLVMPSGITRYIYQSRGGRPSASRDHRQTRRVDPDRGANEGGRLS
jgi:hypothetical protein